MFARIRPAAAFVLFTLLLINLACSAFFSIYWLKDNNWAVGPDELNIGWLSDEDFKAIATSTATQYKLANGSTLVLPPTFGERETYLSRYQLGTPDGRWHGLASSKGHAPTLQTWMGLALPVFLISSIGLVVCRPVSQKFSAEDRAYE